jgi:hypothetical protein
MVIRRDAGYREIDKPMGYIFMSGSHEIRLVRIELGTALLSPGFYPEISGFFETVGIFWGFLFLKVNLGIFLGFFEKGKFEILKFI